MAGLAVIGHVRNAHAFFSETRRSASLGPGSTTQSVPLTRPEHLAQDRDRRPEPGGFTWLTVYVSADRDDAVGTLKVGRRALLSIRAV